jgi:8-amino-7-oxononanoate synthase
VVFTEWVQDQLQRLANGGTLRPSRPGWPGSGQIDAFSNDYFGLAAAAVSRATLLNRSPGSGASRLIFGNQEIHETLESELAAWVGRPAALLFSSGYAANVGTLAALCDSDTIIVSDELNHASIIDGSRLARAEVRVFPHLNLRGVETALDNVPPDKRAMVVTESYFSMDGDQPDLAALSALCRRHGAALFVDEAHALGAFGPLGGGLCAQANVHPDVLVGTLGKAVGLQGAFVACAEATRTLLWNRARSFVFSTATSPLLAELTLGNVTRLKAAESERARLAQLSAELRRRLADAKLAVMSSVGPIVPVRTNDYSIAARYETALREAAVVTRAIRPPTVPVGTERLRLTVHADWPEGVPERIVEILVNAT